MEISQQQLSHYERGVNQINVFHLVEIANLLKTPIGYFFIDCATTPNHSELDQHCHDLTEPQKRAFIELIQTFLD